MTDPVGTIGAAQDRSAPDVKRVFEGGSTFLSRMKELSDLRDAQERAFVQLQIGSDAKAAFDDAAAKQAEARKLREDAAKVFSDANAEAATIIGSARVKAADTLADADGKAASLEEAAKATLASAKQVEADAKKAAADLMAKAKASHAVAVQVEATVKDTNARVVEAERLTDEAKQAANALRSELQSRLDRLKDAIREASQ